MRIAHDPFAIHADAPRALRSGCPGAGWKRHRKTVAHGRTAGHPERDERAAQTDSPQARSATERPAESAMGAPPRPRPRHARPNGPGARSRRAEVETFANTGSSNQAVPLDLS